MNPVQLHLILNHVPVVGVPLALALILGGLARRVEPIVRAGLVVAAVMVLFAGAAFLTGEPAEEALEDAGDVSGAHVHAHEEASEAALWASVAMGIAALLGLAVGRRRDRVPRGAVAAAALLTVLAAVLLARAAHRGGQIHHPEIRTPLAATPGGR